MATHLYGHLAPHLRIVHCDVANHLHATAATYDMLYSVFGGVDFINPGKLQPAAATALRPGGRLVFFILAHEEAGGVFNLSNLCVRACMYCGPYVALDDLAAAPLSVHPVQGCD